MNRHLPLLTASRLSAYRRCPREEQLRYQRGLRTAETEALRFGTLVHVGLEQWWLGAADLTAALASVAGKAVDAFEQARVDALLVGYDLRWKSAGLTALHVEHEFSLPLVNPDSNAESKTWQLAGKMDVVARATDGRVWVIEHKTSSADIGSGSNYIARLRLDGQVSMYFRAAQGLGLEPAGVLYDVIGKVALRPCKRSAEIKLKKDGTPYANMRLADETSDEYQARVLEHIAANPDDYYQRATVVRLDDEVRDFERELWQQAVVMRDGARTGVAYRNTDSCSRFNSMCSFWPLCSGEVTEAAYEKGDVHPELAEVSRAA